jgi:GTP diphosphokinase / guanosine-3',5'-bis(diphosphate) 3'-diphosphatase
MVAQRTPPEVPANAPAVAPPRRSSGNGRATGRAAATPRSPRTSKSPARRQPTVEAMTKDLLASIKRRDPDVDLGPIRTAVDFAIEAHGDQQRASGEPYVTHPIAAAQILAELDIDPTAIEAALLHDVPEDTEYDLPDIEDRFGPEVAQLVDGVTKLSKFSTLSHEQQQAENIRKMFLAMAEDIRVVLIKLADRLHNMRTLAALPIEKQQRIARQTLEIYAPLAERLGIWQVKWELEDLAFKVLEPERFRELAKLLDTRRKARETYIEKAIEELKPRLEAAGIKADLQGRPKHIYSIWKKMQRKSAEFGEIYDVYAIRILVEDVRDCYAALGIVHALWRPIPGQFDDYIAVPKNNLYQSLHTAVIALDGKPLEIQIRTHAMHQVSEVGIAAHWRYKEGSKAERDYDAKLAWLRQLMDWQRDVSDATEFVEGIKLDIFQDQVFVFTPKGDIKDLPAGATPLDFAYRIHTDVGHRTIGAKVNNRLVPLDYRLKNGDIVEVVTTKASHGPSRDWMNVVRTSHAREKIRQWFKRQERDENIVQGREALDRELRRLARTSTQVIGGDRLLEVARQLNHDNLDDFYAAIGYGAIGAQSVVMRLGVVDDTQLTTLPTTAPPPQPSKAGGVRVKGVGDLLVRFARCCHPIPGDPIQGFITRGKGVTVHLRTCPTIINEREVSRLIEVEWDAAPTQTYPIAIRVEAYDRTGILSEITQIVAEAKVNIVAANVNVSPDHTAIVRATLQVASLSQLARVLARLEQLKDVISVSRDLG